MKRFFWLMVAVVMLSGCGNDQLIERALAVRHTYSRQSCAFEAAITADYGDVRRSFRLHCEAEQDGTLHIQVIEPESISGITGVISGGEGKLTFDDQAVAFDLMADGQVSPVSAPWVMLRTLRSGYFSNCTMEQEQLRLSIDDSYQEAAMTLELWVDDQDRLTFCEIYWQNRRLMSIEVKEFQFR